jgi:predicted DNA-binding protein with PD1-like motif
VQYVRQGERVQLRFLSGETFPGPLLDFLAREHVGYASLTGLGAVRAATLSYWNAETQQYETHHFDEQMEVVSLIGNVTLRNDAPFIHAHVTLGRRDLSVIGGHQNELVVHPTLEVWLRPDETPVRRALDDSCGLYVMDLPEQA